MSLKFRIGSVILLLITVGSLVGCSATQNKMSIYSNEERLIETEDNYTFVHKTGKITAKEGAVKFRGFTGLYSAWHLTSDSDRPLKIKITGRVKFGNFKLIHVTAGNKVETIWKGGKETEVTVSVPKGSSTLKWVGQKATGKITITLEPQEGLIVVPTTDFTDDDKDWDLTK